MGLGLGLVAVLGEHLTEVRGRVRVRGRGRGRCEGEGEG